jgi:hypothetical protein
LPYHLFIMNDTTHRRTLTLEPGDAHLLRVALQIRAAALSHHQAEFARKDQVSARLSALVASELEGTRRLLSQLEP